MKISFVISFRSVTFHFQNEAWRPFRIFEAKKCVQFLEVFYNYYILSDLYMAIDTVK